MQNHFVRYCSVCILIFGLVACGGGSSSVTPSNDPPIANAGVAQNVTLGPVFLDGSASSDANGDPLSYSWVLSSKPNVSLASLSSPLSVSPSFNADLAGNYVLTLVVHDGKAASVAASVTIAAVASNSLWQARIASHSYIALPATTDDTVNPLRGYYRWNKQEKVTQASPALDAYQRYRWRDLETSAGVYDFSVVLSDLQLAKSQGRKFALRVQMMLGYDDDQVYLPAYLVNNANCTAGCGWLADYDAGNPGLTFVPDWNDVYLQQRASALLQALANALGNEEDIAWIDIGLFGQYGEWALSSAINYATAPAGITAASDASKREFVDMHLRAFSNRQLVMFAIYSRYNEVRYATLQQTIASKPVGLRIDCLGRGGFMNQWTNHPTEWASLQNVWKTAPFVAEFCQFASGDVQDNPGVAMQQVQDFHISTIGNGNIGDGSVNSWSSFNPTEQQQFIQLGREAGYRYWAESTSVDLNEDGLLSVSALIRNDGNAPTYEPWDVLLELKNADGLVVWSTTLSSNLNALKGNGTSQLFDTAIQLPGLASGDYRLQLTARDGRRNTAGVVRAPLRWVTAERNAEGGLDLTVLHKN